MHSAISVFGSDRPGIIASLTSRLASMDVNIEDASMTLLQGHFAMILVVEHEDVSVSDIKISLEQVRELEGLTVTFSDFSEGANSQGQDSSVRYIFHLSVNDKPGIVARVTEVLAKHKSNIVDCSTRKNNDTGVFTMVLDVDIVLNEEEKIVDELSAATSDYSGDVVFQRVDEVDL